MKNLIIVSILMLCSSCATTATPKPHSATTPAECGSHIECYDKAMVAMGEAILAVQEFRKEAAEEREKLRKELQEENAREREKLKLTIVPQCRVCFRETEGSSQCQGNRNACSAWTTAKHPTGNWTQAFRDDTDNRAGGCYYQWKIECRPQPK